jgi:hypothetical protein
MSHRIQSNRAGELTVEYGWQLGSSRNKIGLNVKGDPAPVKQGSEEQFITEHHWGYTRQKDGSCAEYRVVHAAWNVWSGENVVVEGEMEKLYGNDLAAILTSSPASAFLADGSAVTVSRGRRL